MFLTGGSLLTGIYTFKSRENNKWELLKDNFSKIFISIVAGFFALASSFGYILLIVGVLQTALINFSKIGSDDFLSLKIAAFGGLVLWVPLSILITLFSFTKVCRENLEKFKQPGSVPESKRWSLLKGLFLKMQIHIPIGLGSILLFFLIAFIE